MRKEGNGDKGEGQGAGPRNADDLAPDDVWEDVPQRLRGLPSRILEERGIQDDVLSRVREHEKRDEIDRSKVLQARYKALPSPLKGDRFRDFRSGAEDSILSYVSSGGDIPGLTSMETCALSAVRAEFFGSRNVTMEQVTSLLEGDAYQIERMVLHNLKYRLALEEALGELEQQDKAKADRIREEIGIPQKKSEQRPASGQPPKHAGGGAPRSPEPRRPERKPAKKEEYTPEQLSQAMSAVNEYFRRQGNVGGLSGEQRAALEGIRAGGQVSLSSLPVETQRLLIEILPPLVLGETQPPRQASAPRQAPAPKPVQRPAQEQQPQPQQEREYTQAELDRAREAFKAYLDLGAKGISGLKPEEENVLDQFTVAAGRYRHMMGETVFSTQLRKLPPYLMAFMVEDLPDILTQDKAVYKRMGDRRQARVSPAPQPEKIVVSGGTEWRRTPRATEVGVIGDIHGVELGLRCNLVSAGLARRGRGSTLEWTGGNQRVVFLGDIVGDRGMGGIDSIMTIKKLRQQAEAAGGSVEVISGNHERLVYSFLMEAVEPGIEEKSRSEEVKYCSKHDYNGLFELSRFGSPELRAHFEKNKNKASIDQEAWDMLRAERTQILQNMRNDSEGREFLEELCGQEVVTIIDDNLIFHLDPTLSAMQILFESGAEKIREKVKAINSIYQTSLRESLIEGKQITRRAEFGRIRNVFHATVHEEDNSHVFYSEKPKPDEYAQTRPNREEILKMMEESGMHAIIHGHSSVDAGVRSKSPGPDLLDISVDNDAFKPGGGFGGGYEEKRAILEIDTRGIMRYGADKTIQRR